MKVLLYFEGEAALAKSGIGRALVHQKKALTEVGIEYTTDPNSSDYDILHLNTYGPKSRSMIRRARKANKKVVYHAHSTEEDFRDSFVGSNQIAPLFKRYLVDLYRRADIIITPTPYSKSLLETYDLNVPIKAISNGIDLAKYEYRETKEQMFRDYFQIQKNQKVIMSVGLFFERKGIIDFVEVAKKFPDYQFIWFGHTPLYSIPRQIRELVLHNHPENVSFPGYIQGEIIEGAYTASDLFFFPSYEETEGIVVLEALASRQKIIVRDIPVYDPWLQDGVNCYKGHHVDDFVNLIEGVFSGSLKETKTKGYEVAEKRSLLKVGQALERVYQDLLTKEETTIKRAVY